MEIRGRGMKRVVVATEESISCLHRRFRIGRLLLVAGKSTIRFRPIAREKSLIHYLKKPLQCVGVGIRMQQGHPREEGIGLPQYYAPLRGASLCPGESYYYVNIHATLLTSMDLNSQKNTVRARSQVSQLTKHPSSALLRP